MSTGLSAHDILNTMLHASRVLENVVYRRNPAVEFSGICPITILALQPHEAEVRIVIADGNYVFESVRKGLESIWSKGDDAIASQDESTSYKLYWHRRAFKPATGLQ